jgi:hypothetical protein
MTDETAEQNYQKMPGSGIFNYLFSFSLIVRTQEQLWEGDSHLLKVTSAFVQERYNRFYYEDIEAVYSRKTEERFWINLVSGSLFVLLFVVSLFMPISWSYRILLGFALGFLPLLALIINVVKGPTCETYIQTPAKKYELSSLNRESYVNRFVSRLRSRIQEHQPSLSREELLERYRSIGESESEAQQERTFHESDVTDRANT